VRTLRPVLAVVVAAFIAVPASASAMQITRHIYAGGGTYTEVTVDVAPPDADDDGCANPDDSYAGPGCKAPPPPPEPAPVTPVATAPSPEPIAPAPAPTTGGCPSSMSGEADSPTDVNPYSGASGCYQVTPGTQQEMGAACSDVNAPSCLAAICAAQGNSAWEASGSTPCG